MNAIFDQGIRVAQEVSYNPTEDASANWFRQKDHNDIKMGKKTGYAVAHNHAEWNFLQHHAEPDGQVQLNAMQEDKGLNQTRFHKGFRRRNVNDIVDKQAALEKQAIKEQMQETHLAKRRDHLDKVDKQNEYHLITGAYNPDKVKDPSKKIVDDFRNHPERQKYGEILMRDSHNRFFLPPYSGPKHDQRQMQLVTEGVLKPKMSSVLGIGRNDVPSYGVEDQLSKADYIPCERIQIEGHYERNQPGRWTPNQHQMYPEGYWQPSVFNKQHPQPHQVQHRTPPPSNRADRTIRHPMNPLPQFDRETGTAPINQRPDGIAGVQDYSNRNRGNGERWGSAPPQLGSVVSQGDQEKRSSHVSFYQRSGNQSMQHSTGRSSLVTPMQRREQVQLKAEIEALRKL